MLQARPGLLHERNFCAFSAMGEGDCARYCRQTSAFLSHGEPAGNITLRDVSLAQSNPSDEAHGDALTVVATILSENLALALHSDLAEGMEQSRIRCKFATLFVTKGIVERLRSSLDDGPKRTRGVLGATPSEGPAIDG